MVYYCVFSVFLVVCSRACFLLHKRRIKMHYVKNDDVMDLIVVFCILFVFMLVLYCFCVATEFSVNKALYIRFGKQR